LADQELVEKWKAYTNQGGHLLLTCRTAVKDKMGHYPELKRAGIITDLIGGQLAETHEQLAETRGQLAETHSQQAEEHGQRAENHVQFRKCMWMEVL
jgi:hypothetical protein